MRRDPTVFIIGESTEEAGTPLKVLSGLAKEFGTKRVIDSPISEAGIAGIGVGAAMTGMRPHVDIMFGDFIILTMDQLAEPSGQDPLYVRRQTQSADGPADNPRRHAPVCRATQPKLTRVAEPCSWIEGCRTVHAIRCQGTAQERYSRRQSRGLFRRTK